MNARTFRKKPIEVKAVQYTGHNLSDVAINLRCCFSTVLTRSYADPAIVAEVYDKFHSTWVGVRVGDWIIRGVSGECYPCDPEVFKLTYEAITS